MNSKKKTPYGLIIIAMLLIAFFIEYITLETQREDAISEFERSNDYKLEKAELVTAKGLNSSIAVTIKNEGSELCSFYPYLNLVIDGVNVPLRCVENQNNKQITNVEIIPGGETVTLLYTLERYATYEENTAFRKIGTTEAKVVVDTDSFIEESECDLTVNE